MIQFMKELKPASLEDVIAGISLYRPGPINQIPRYLKNKNNPGEIKYHHPLFGEYPQCYLWMYGISRTGMQIVRGFGRIFHGKVRLGASCNVQKKGGYNGAGEKEFYIRHKG